MTRDGVNFETFHSKSEGISPNLLLISDGKYIFGGFTKVCWEKKDTIKNDNESFLFSLNNNKKYYQKHKDRKTIYCFKDYGPWFWGGDIGFQSKDMSQCYTSQSEYLTEPITDHSINKYFTIEEVELFKIMIE